MWHYRVNLLRIFNHWVKNGIRIRIPTSYLNIAVKTASFYLKRFQRYGVLKCATFLAHPVYCSLGWDDSYTPLHWRRWDVLGIFGFTNDVTLWAIRRHSIPLQRVTSLRRRAQDNAPAASYWSRRVLDDGWRRDEKSLQCKGRRGRSLQCTLALIVLHSSKSSYIPS